MGDDWCFFFCKRKRGKGERTLDGGVDGWLSPSWKTDNHPPPCSLAPPPPPPHGLNFLPGVPGVNARGKKQGGGGRGRGGMVGQTELGQHEGGTYTPDGTGPPTSSHFDFDPRYYLFKRRSLSLCVTCICTFDSDYVNITCGQPPGGSPLPVGSYAGNRQCRVESVIYKR